MSQDPETGAQSANVFLKPVHVFVCTRIIVMQEYTANDLVANKLTGVMEENLSENKCNYHSNLTHQPIITFHFLGIDVSTRKINVLINDPGCVALSIAIDHSRFTSPYNSK